MEINDFPQQARWKVIFLCLQHTAKAAASVRILAMHCCPAQPKQPMAVMPRIIINSSTCTSMQLSSHSPCVFCSTCIISSISICSRTSA